MDQSCLISSPNLSHIEVISLCPENIVKDYNEAVTLAEKQAEQRFDEYMLIS